MPNEENNVISPSETLRNNDKGNINKHEECNNISNQ